MDNKVSKLYKYREFNQYTEKIITNSALWYANPFTFNDPFDMSLSFRQKYSKREIKAYVKNFIQNYEDTKDLPATKQEHFRRRFEKLSNTNAKFIKENNSIMYDQISNTGVVSLSQCYDSILMWSHYGGNHKGLVFEFDYSDKKLNLNEFPHKVDYIEEYDLLSYVENRSGRKKQMIKMLLSKFIAWSYEKEYRIVDFDFQGERTFDKKMLTKIIFGMRASLDNVHNTIQLCKDHGFEHVKFEKAEKIEGTFKLQMIPI